MASSSIQTADVFRFPRSKKRGRKVTKGPAATVHTLYEAPEPSRVEESIEDSVKRIVQLVAERFERKKVEWAAILAANPQIVEFPEKWRYRSLHEVNEHRRAHEGGSMCQFDHLAGRIAARVDELMEGDIA